MSIGETARQWLIDRPPVGTMVAAVAAMPGTQRAAAHILGSVVTACVVGLGGYLIALPKLEAQLEAVRLDVGLVRQDIRDMRDGIDHRREIFDQRLRAVEIGQAEQARGRHVESR